MTPAPRSSSSPIFSMTGFASVEGLVAGQRMRLEIKTLNHRFLDIKIRLPRDLSSADILFRAAISSRFGRGALDAKLERIQDSSGGPAELPPMQGVQTNFSLAANYYEAFVKLQKTLGMTDPIKSMDIATFPGVLSIASQEIHAGSPEAAWKHIEPLAEQAFQQLLDMRNHEGKTLQKVILELLSEISELTERVKKRRGECQEILRSKTQEKVKGIWELYPIQGADTQLVMESRIAQELAMILDRSDVEEEIVRLTAHIDHFRKILSEGGAVGRKLDFILQELNREVNTLGTKSHDIPISEDVIELKVKLEQIREQVMNLE